MRHGLAILASLLAVSGPSLAAPDLASCRTIADDRARLACYDTLAGRPDVQLSNFGADRLPRKELPKEELATLSAHIRQVWRNAFGRFTVALDNGQVWRQLDSDSGKPRLREGEAITISQGLFDSYNLTPEGTGGVYKVRRIQ